MAQMTTTQNDFPAPAVKFGVFLGVYTPSVLTILGAIMYLRFGWVVGNAGLGMTLLIVCLASSITAVTALSASAIATNMRVGAGGEYYMISRSLGLELGGAIGIPLFLCRTLSITLYGFALAESIVGFESPNLGWVTAGIIVFTTLVAGRSASLSLKMQIPIMLMVGASILALMIGALTSNMHQPEWQASYRTAEVKSFWYVFAVFFPAVTGFGAGIGMSGDLADPKRSIPKGTMLAVATGWFVYMVVPVLLAISLSGDQLAFLGEGQRVPWSKVALLGPVLVFPGMFGAILSSAFGSALVGPRVLQALASDGLAPRFLARLSRTGQPTVATWITGAIALAAVLLGDLNAVAEWVTIFFLTFYVTVNLAAATESLVRDPSYRPTIRVPWWLSLLGSLGAVGVMFLINPWACAIAVLLELLLWTYLRRRSMKRQWGDVRAGFWLALARQALVRLRDLKLDARNWRPHILLFAGEVEKRIDLVRLASWFNQERGVLTVCRIITGELQDQHERVESVREGIDETLKENGLIAFGEVNVVKNFERGVVAVTQANGIAGLHSNTVMFGWTEKRGRLESIVRIMERVALLGKSTILARIDTLSQVRRPKRIDIWWRGKENNGDLMLLLAHLLRLNQAWRGSQIRVRSIVGNESQREAMQENLTHLIAETRIHAAPDVIVKPADKDIVQVLHEHSGDADLVFLGLAKATPGAEAEYAARLCEIAGGFNASVFVRNAGPFQGQLI